MCVCVCVDVELDVERKDGDVESMRYRDWERKDGIDDDDEKNDVVLTLDGRNGAIFACFRS